MNVTVISSFRNSVPTIPRYFDQVGALAKLLASRGDQLRLILGYGDSIDGTGEMLHEEATFSMDALLVDVSHGGPVFTSVVDPVRFKQLAYVGNTLAACIDDSADVVAWCESDLLWDAPTMVGLIDHLHHVPAIAPMIMDGEHSFYDIYAFRKNGVHFTKQPPYHDWLDRCAELVQVDSAGSVLVVRGDLARKARFSEQEVVVGYSKDIYRYGGSIWLDTQATVRHHP